MGTCLVQSTDELQTATVMLVMAALRGSDARAIFNAADSDGDGSLTFQEWLAWLQRGSRNKDISKLDFSTIPNQYNGRNNGEQQQQQLDPSLTNSLGLVLSHAVSTLKVVSRLGSSTPSELCAAYIAGGILSGGIDRDATSQILSCLPPATRDIVMLSLTMEASSLGQRPTTYQFDQSYQQVQDQGQRQILQEEEDDGATINK